MIIIHNEILPFGRFKAINLFDIIFYKGSKLNDVVINHEAIHTAQMKELLYIGFYIWYVIEWLFRLVQYGFSKKAYKNISFEKEAFANENNLEYLKERRHYECFRRKQD